MRQRLSGKHNMSVAQTQTWPERHHDDDDHMAEEIAHQLTYSEGIDSPLGGRDSKLSKEQNFATDSMITTQKSTRLNHIFGLDSSRSRLDEQITSDSELDRVREQTLLNGRRKTTVEDLTWLQYIIQTIMWVFKSSSATAEKYSDDNHTEAYESRSWLSWRGRNSEMKSKADTLYRKRVGYDNDKTDQSLSMWEKLWNVFTSFMSSSTAIESSERLNDDRYSDDDDDDNDNVRSNFKSRTSTTGGSIHELSSHPLRSKRKSHYGHQTIDNDSMDDSKSTVWWKRLGTRLVRHFSPPRPIDVRSATAGMTQDYIEPWETKRRRPIAQEERKQSAFGSACRSVLFLLIGLLQFVVMLPFELVHHCWLLVKKLLQGSGHLSTLVWEQGKSFFSVITGMALQTDTYLLSKTSHARSYSGCCCLLPCLFLLPLLLVGAYYLLACGQGGATLALLPTMLLSSDSYLYQLFIGHSAANQIALPVIPVPDLPDPLATPLPSGAPSWSDADLDSRIKEIYTRSQSKIQADSRRSLEIHRAELDRKLSELKADLSLVNNKVLSIESLAGQSGDGKSEQWLLQLQSDHSKEIQLIHAELEKLRSEQKKISESSASLTDNLKSSLTKAAQQRESDLERRLKESYRLELEESRRAAEGEIKRMMGLSMSELERKLSDLTAELMLVMSKRDQDPKRDQTAAMPDQKYIQLIDVHSKQIQDILDELRRLTIARDAIQAEIQQSSDDKSKQTERGASHSAHLDMTKVELDERIRQLYIILSAEQSVQYQKEQQKQLDEHTEQLNNKLQDVQRQLQLVIKQQSEMTTVSQAASGSTGDKATLVQEQHSLEIENIRLSLQQLHQGHKARDDDIVTAFAKMKDYDEKSRTNADAIAALEARLQNLTSTTAHLGSLYEGLALQMSNCCRNATALRDLVRVGIADYMNLITKTKVSDKEEGAARTDESGSSAFALWLASQFASHQDVDEKIAKVSNAIHKEFIEAQRLSVVDVRRESSVVNELNVISKEDVAGMIREQLRLYDADKTGRFDFALESAGGSVISTRCTRAYMPRTALYSVFGVPLWYTSNSPRIVIQPGLQPGECWAFEGSEGYLVMQLSSPTIIQQVSIEHIPKRLSPTGKIDSAPKNFSVWGLQEEYDKNPTPLGNFTYSESSDESLQTFNVMHKERRPFQIIELMIHSNHGHPEYTCLYRFRVHGEYHRT